MTMEATGSGRCATRWTTAPDARQAAKASAPLRSPAVASAAKPDTAPVAPAAKLSSPSRTASATQHCGMSDHDGRIAPHQREPEHHGGERRQHGDAYRLPRIADRREGAGRGERSGERHQRFGGAEQHRQQCGAARAQDQRPERQRHRDVVEAEHESKLHHVHGRLTT